MSKIISEEEAKMRIYASHEDKITLLNYTKLTDYSNFHCNVCGNQWTAVVDAVARGSGCPHCDWLRKQGRFSLSYDYVKEQIKKEGYKLVSTEYSNAQENLNLICPKGHSWDTSWNNFQQGQRCKVCQDEKRALAQRIPNDTLMEYLKEDGFEFINFPNGYINRLSYIIYKCEHGHVNTKKIREYLKSRNCTTCTSIKQAENQRGSNGSNWQGGLTSLTKGLKKLMIDWKKESISSSNYKCVITGDRFNDVHHLYSFNLILKEALEDLSFKLKPKFGDYTAIELNQLYNKLVELHKKYPLGVCLRKDIHALFHKIYGSGDNLPEQWYEFVDEINNGTIRIA